MKLKGRAVNGGDVEGETIVLQNAFNFTGDFDFKNGTVAIKGHSLFGERIAGKILVIPYAKGAGGAAISIFNANKMGNTPIGIVCQKADPITVESAMIIDIPVVDSFDKDVLKIIKTDDHIKILGEKGIIIIVD